LAVQNSVPNGSHISEFHCPGADTRRKAVHQYFVSVAESDFSVAGAEFALDKK
jgi:hypothetical protein